MATQNSNGNLGHLLAETVKTFLKAVLRLFLMLTMVIIKIVIAVLQFYVDFVDARISNH